jgi:CheY-like chemotaxis protein
MEGLSQHGNGLGLSISKQFVEMHGGKMGVASQAGMGSTFWLSLPTQVPDTPLQKPDRWIHSEWAWHERQGHVNLPNMPRQRRIILLDANDGIHTLLDEGPEPIEFISKCTVEEVVQVASEAPAHGIVINGPTTEMIMPMIEEVCHRVPDTPVVGWALPTPTNRALAAGAMEYLVKPVTRGDIIDVLALVPTPVKCILLVDDDEEVQRLLTRILYAHNETIQVHTATDVESAISLLHAAAPDLMLLDLTLNQGTGWEILARKQEHPAIAAIPAVILSAQDPMEHSLQSPFLVARMGSGLPLASLRQASLAWMEMLLNGSAEPNPVSE